MMTDLYVPLAWPWFVATDCDPWNNDILKLYSSDTGSIFDINSVTQVLLGELSYLPQPLIVTVSTKVGPTYTDDGSWV